MSSINVQFGSLQNVFGIPRSQDGFTIMPAIVRLNGNGFSTRFHLKDAVGKLPPAILAAPLKQQYDAAWVRARLPRLFGFTPDLSEMEKSLINAGFVAVADGNLVGFPFVCADYYGRTGLMFSPEGPEPNIQANVAKVFWSLLLQSPEDLSDFQAKAYHSGAGVWMHYSCTDGELGYEESD